MNPFLLCTILPFLFFWPDKPNTFYSTDLNNGMEKAIVESIYGAKKSVDVSVYTLSSHNIIQALRDQAQNGVQVKVIVDKKASSGVQKKLGSQVKTTLVEGRGLMHHKILVIDDKDVWLGSANMTRESLRSHSNLMEKFTSIQLAGFVKDKLHALAAPGLTKKFAHRTFTIDSQTLEFWFLPDDPGGSLRIKELIRSSQKTIRVAMYTFTRYDFADTLVHAARRGVQVEVVMDSAMCQGVCNKVVGILKNGNVPIFASEGKSLLHTKMMVIDDKILVQGSANWTKAAFTQNEDYFIVLYNLTSPQKSELDDIWKALLKRSKLL